MTTLFHFFFLLLPILSEGLINEHRTTGFVKRLKGSNSYHWQAQSTKESLEGKTESKIDSKKTTPPPKESTPSPKKSTAPPKSTPTPKPTGTKTPKKVTPPVVIPVGPTTTQFAPPTTVGLGSVILITVQVTSNNPAFPSTPPSGSVALEITDPSSGESVTIQPLDENGMTTFTVTFSQVGNYNLDATFVSDQPGVLSSQSSATVQVVSP